MAQDDEYVASLMGDDDEDDERPAAGPRLSEYTPTVEALHLVADRLADVISVTQAMGGKKPKRIPPVRRPTTAFDRQRRARQDRAHLSLVARLLPHGYQPIPDDTA